MDTGQVMTQSAKRVSYSYIVELKFMPVQTYVHALTFILSFKTGGCVLLKAPEYGTVKVTGTHVGAKATYTCDYGYELVGRKVRECQYDGYWSGDHPKCKKSKLYT